MCGQPRIALLWLDDAKPGERKFGAAERQQIAVFGHQQAGATVARQLKEFLVVGVAALRQASRLSGAGMQARDTAQFFQDGRLESRLYQGFYCLVRQHPLQFQLSGQVSNDFYLLRRLRGL